jgi:hypothetical protein
MMSFYETVYTVRVLSEYPIPEGWELEDVLEEADTGDYVGKITQGEARAIEGPECARLLCDYGSDPGFFNLTEAGLPVEE